MQWVASTLHTTSEHGVPSYFNCPVHQTKMCMCVYTHSWHIARVLRCLSVAQDGQSVQPCSSVRIVCLLHCSGFENNPTYLILIRTILFISNQTSILHPTFNHFVFLNTFHHFSDICLCSFPHQSSVIHP